MAHCGPTLCSRTMRAGAKTTVSKNLDPLCIVVLELFAKLYAQASKCLSHTGNLLSTSRRAQSRQKRIVIECIAFADRGWYLLSQHHSEPDADGYCWNHQAAYHVIRRGVGNRLCTITTAEYNGEGSPNYKALYRAPKLATDHQSQSLSDDSASLSTSHNTEVEHAISNCSETVPAQCK